MKGCGWAVGQPPVALAAWRSELRSGRTAGLLVVHQAPPTAKGFHFLTLEDEDGFINVIVNPQVYAEYRPIIRGSAFLLVEGIVQREGVVTNLLAEGFTEFV